MARHISFITCCYLPVSTPAQNHKSTACRLKSAKTLAMVVTQSNPRLTIASPMPESLGHRANVAAPLITYFKENIIRQSMTSSKCHSPLTTFNNYNVDKKISLNYQDLSSILATTQLAHVVTHRRIRTTQVYHLSKRNLSKQLTPSLLQALKNSAYRMNNKITQPTSARSGK